MKRFTHFFFPTEEHHYIPGFLKTKTVAWVLSCLFFIELAIFISLYPPLTNFVKANLSAIAPHALIFATNTERKQYAAKPLGENELLTRAAQLKADDMANRQFFAHINPDGEKPWVYLDRVGYEYQVAGENLAVNFSESDSLHQAWMDSPTHRANIVQSAYTDIGIATAQGTFKGKDATYVVQFFGKEKPTYDLFKFLTTKQPIEQKQTISDQFVYTSSTSAQVLGTTTGLAQRIPVILFLYQIVLTLAVVFVVVVSMQSQRLAKGDQKIVILKNSLIYIAFMLICILLNTYFFI